MSVIEAIILGLIQGLTEFLPVSSSGHLVIAQDIFGIENTNNLTFTTLVHAGTVLATITVFWGEISKLFTRGLTFRATPERDYILRILVSMIPVLIVGLFLKDYVEGFFSEDLMFIGFMLLITASLLTLSHFIKAKTDNGSQEVSFKNAFLIGLAQAVAVIPGISRSGATISTGLMLGVKREALAKFSFLMVLVPILGETFLELYKGDFSMAQSGISAVAMASGFVAAFVSGVFACRTMIAIVNRGKLYWFAVYCAIVGVILITTSI